MPSHVSQSLWLWWEGSTVPCITDHLMNQHTENKKNILISYILQTLQYTYRIITNQCCQDPIPLGPWLLSLSNFFSLKSNFRSVSCLVRHWRISSLSWLTWLTKDLRRNKSNLKNNNNHEFSPKSVLPRPAVVEFEGQHPMEWSRRRRIPWDARGCSCTACFAENGHFLASLWRFPRSNKKIQGMRKPNEPTWDIMKYIQIHSNMCKYHKTSINMNLWHL